MTERASCPRRRNTEPRLVAEVPGLLARLGLHEIDATVRATAAAYDAPACGRSTRSTLPRPRWRWASG